MSFFCTILFMVLVFWRPQEWLVPALYGFPLLDIIIVLALIALLAEIGERQAEMRRGPIPWLIFGLWFATLMSHVVHTYFAGLVRTFPETGKICLFTLLLFTLVDRPRRIRTVAFVFVGMAGVMAVHALMQARTGYGFGWLRPVYIPARGDAPAYIRTLFYGIFSDPNDPAQILTMAIPMIFLVPRRLNVLAFVLCAAMVVFLYMAIETTHSRGGQVGLLACAATMVFVSILPPGGWPFLLAMGMGGALLACATMAAPMMDMSSRDRVVFWGLANQQFKQNPLFGIGYGMFWQVASDRAAHNAFVNCYTELGLFGYWFWFCLLQLGIVANWHARKALSGMKGPEVSYLRRASSMVIAAAMAYAASAYFLSRTWIYPCFFLLALMNGIPYVVRRYLPKDAPELIDPRRDLMKLGTWAALGSVVFIYVSILILNKVFYG